MRFFIGTHVVPGFVVEIALADFWRTRRLDTAARAALMILVRQIDMINTEIDALDSTLRKENKASALGPSLETIPSVGPVIASALRARVTDAKLFENGRHLSACGAS